MDLQEFIQKSLVSIANGISAANQGVDEKAFELHNNPSKDEGYVKFDVAVTVKEGVEGNAGRGIRILEVGLDGKVSGHSAQENSSRIKFSVRMTRDVK